MLRLVFASFAWSVGRLSISLLFASDSLFPSFFSSTSVLLNAGPNLLRGFLLLSLRSCALAHAGRGFSVPGRKIFLFSEKQAGLDLAKRETGRELAVLHRFYRHAWGGVRGRQS